MLKKLCALIMAFAMVASLVAVSAAAADEPYKGERGEFSYFIDGRALAPSEKVPAGKTVDVKVRVKNDMSTSRFFTLFTALYNDEGAMVAVKNTQPTWLGNSAGYYGTALKISITAPAEPVNKTYDVKSFVWENTSTLLPCKTVVTETPVAPFAVSVANAKERSVIRWPNIAKQNGGKLGETKDVYGYTVYRDGVEIGTAQQSSNEFIVYHDTTPGRGGEYSVTAYGLNDSEMSMGVKDVTEAEYITQTLSLDDVENFLNTTTTDDWKAVSSGAVKLTNYYTTGGLGVYEQEGGGMNTYTAYDKNFATNKTANTYGFCEIEADGVKKKCLATKDLNEGKICIAVPDGEVLSSTKKIVKLTVLDNAEKVLRLRYAPTSGSRQHFEYKLTGKGGWITLLAAIDDTYTGSIADKGYVFEFSYSTYGASYFPGETYIADISISAPKQTPAE